MYVGNKIELFLICMRRENQGLNIGSISSEGEMQYQQNTPNQLTCPKSNGTRLDKPGVGGSNPPSATKHKKVTSGGLFMFYGAVFEPSWVHSKVSLPAVGRTSSSKRFDRPSIEPEKLKSTSASENRSILEIPS